MIILKLVAGHEETFVTFHQLKSCRSTKRQHSVLDIKGVPSPHPLLLGNYLLFAVFLFVCLFERDRERQNKTKKRTHTNI